MTMIYLLIPELVQSYIVLSSQSRSNTYVLSIMMIRFNPSVQICIVIVAFHILTKDCVKVNHMR